ncbi:MULTISPECIES: response regulator transcription factor [unclassified Streptomyces]|uniref:helix-turn-helix transcriptional regulator n=1 Tax=unclassified Streptomyces TaxID=2593676 RepID=UPI003807C147
MDGEAAAELHEKTPADDAGPHRDRAVAFPERFDHWLRLAGLERLKLAVRIAESEGRGLGDGEGDPDSVGQAVRWLCEGRDEVVPPLVLEHIATYTRTVDDEARRHTRRASQLTAATAALMESAEATRADRCGDPLGTGHPANLTAREYQVLLLIGAALKNRQISASLQISEKTVKNHITSLFAKLGVSDRTEAVITGLREGLLTVPDDGRTAEEGDEVRPRRRRGHGAR